MRHALGYYRALIVTGRYTMPNGFSFNKESFYPALKHCISTHPMLSAAIKGEQTEAPEFIRPATLNLSDHVEFLKSIEPANAGMHAELEALKPRLCHTHDQLFSNVDSVPPWKIVVVPIANDANPKACWILFSYSHSHGDGPSALFFHRTLLHALRDPSLPPSTTATTNPIFTPPATPLLPPIELTVPLPITWSFLLLPVLSSYLPTALSILLPRLFRASVTPQTPDTWAGTPTAYDAPAFRTGAAFAVAAPATVAALLRQCRARRGVKLTGVLHALVVRALGASLPADGRARAFVAQTAIDLRRLVPGGAWRGAFGLGVSVAYHAFPRADAAAAAGTFDEAFWASAKETTAHLAERAGTLVDQPIGLLRYLRSFRGWLEGMMGKTRDSSYEISNILVFDPEEGEQRRGGGGGWGIDGMVFSQPANATGSPVNFNVVTTKGGDMVVSLTWQKGVLGVEQDEDEWAKRVCEHLERDMEALAEEK
ncbi:Alcohol acetyltransferase [Botryosphaeria dothidea]